jgi:hypothetical protein
MYYGTKVWLHLVLRILFVILCIVLVVLIAGEVFAKRCAKNQPPHCTKLHGAHAGCETPCTGLTGPENKIREAMRCIAPKGDLAACNAKVKLEQERREADKIMHNTVLRSETKRADTCCKLALRKRPPTPPPAWYETTTFKIVVAVVVTATVVGTTVALLYETEAVKP